MKTTQIIEALLFASDAPLSADDLARGEEELDGEAVVAAVQELRQAYEAEGRAFQIYEIAGGYQLLTRPEYSPHLERFETVPRNARLSGAALEVLAIIAYRQPIGRSEVEEIRGVGSSSVLRTLQEVGLIDVVGRGEGLGRPLLYGTTERFLDHFGFASLADLPRPDELPVVLKEPAPPAEPAAEGEGEPGEEPSQDAEVADGVEPAEAADREEATGEPGEDAHEPGEQAPEESGEDAERAAEGS